MKKEDTEIMANHEFYREALQMLTENHYKFLVGGGAAMQKYTSINRDSKDLDLFTTNNEFHSILRFFGDKGYETEYTDVRWLAKVYKGKAFIDLIFNTVNNLCPVDESWFEHAVNGSLFGIPVQYIAPEELIWCKIYIHNRERYDASDINHIILKQGHQLDWHRIFRRLDQHWHLLLGQFINFLFVYPSERDIIPRWLFEKLLKRARSQYDLPPSIEKVCLGPIIDQTQYSIDIREWNFKTITIKTV